jgi:hypothetical protein
MKTQTYSRYMKRRNNKEERKEGGNEDKLNFQEIKKSQN